MHLLTEILNWLVVIVFLYDLFTQVHTRTVIEVLQITELVSWQLFADLCFAVTLENALKHVVLQTLCSVWSSVKINFIELCVLFLEPTHNTFFAVDIVAEIFWNCFAHKGISCLVDKLVFELKVGETFQHEYAKRLK